MRSLESLIKVNKSWNGNVFNNDLDSSLKQDTFLEFIEKLVILDVLFDSYIHDNFIKYKSFPFSHEGFLGHETAVWDHYRSKYAKELSSVAFLD